MSSRPKIAPSPAEAELRRAAAERILVLDGAMGTMIQEMGLDEDEFRGARYDAWNREVRGNNDLLNLTRPDAIHDIHIAYLRAGADIIATNTFSSTAIAQADYGLSEAAYELNREGAALARHAADLVRKRDGRTEPFDIAKVRLGMVRAMADPESHAAALDAALARIEAFAEEHSPEVATEEIGRQVLAELRHIDEAAYLRFASVYKNFSEASDFSREVESLEKRR